MDAEQIKTAVVNLLDARAKLEEASNTVRAMEDRLTDLFRDESTILDEFNTVNIEGDYWNLNFDCEDWCFKSLKKDRTKYF